VETVQNGRWNVMTVEREPGQWYLGGTMAAFTGPPPFGWVQRLDPESFEAVATSPELPCGEHVWCGAIQAHANGTIVSVNGSFIHVLDPDDLSIIAERQLPVDRSHNGMLTLADGSLLAKDLRLEGQGGTTLTRLDPATLALIDEPLVLPEGSMGRIAADLVADGTEQIYVPGTEHFWRLTVAGDQLTIDDWRPRYRSAGDPWGLAWDVCLSDGGCWIMDCGDIESVRLIHETEPNGRYDVSPGSDLSWRRPAPWTGPQRLHRFGLDAAADGDVDSTAIEPFGTPGGGIIAPSVHVPEVNRAVAWDSINGGLAGIELHGDETAGSSGELNVVWQLDVRASMQPVVFPDSGELVINDFTSDGEDHVIVVDLVSGELLARVPTGSRVANGMFLSAGGNRDVFYCSTLTYAHIRWR